jgi:multidrug efflux pump subunit AcrA (membrane-fusion protein)
MQYHHYRGWGMKPKICWCLLGVLAACAWGCGDKIEPGHSAANAGSPVRTKVAVARVSSWPLVFEAVGTVQAETASTIGAKLLGTVTSVRVQEGDRVRMGDVLVTIDERQVSAQRQQAEAALAEARQMEQAAGATRDAATAGADLATATYHRYATLIAQESVSRQEFDDVNARFRQAQASLGQSEDRLKAAVQRVRQAEAALTSARVSAADAAVKAPFDAIVTAKIVDAGDLAVPGRPLLSLEKDGGHRVDIRLPEAYVGAVRPGQTAPICIGGTSQPPIEGVIDTVAPAADPETHSFLVKIRLPSRGDLRSGMFARVEISVGESQLIAIPSTAIVHQGQLTGLFLLTSESTARFRLIRTGRSLGDDMIEVLSGLSEETRFVVTPSPDLVDGARIEAFS